jgi:flagellar capping protein FliD
MLTSTDVISFSAAEIQTILNDHPGDYNAQAQAFADLINDRMFDMDLYDDISGDLFHEASIDGNGRLIFTSTMPDAVFVNGPAATNALQTLGFQNNQNLSAGNAGGGSFRVALNGTIQTISFTAAEIEAIKNAHPSNTPADIRAQQEDFAALIDSRLAVFGNDSDGNRRITAEIDVNGRLVLEPNPGRGHRMTLLNATTQAANALPGLGFFNNQEASLNLNQSLSEFLSADFIPNPNFQPDDTLPNYDPNQFLPNTVGPNDYIRFTINGEDFEFDGDNTIQDIINAVNANSNVDARMSFNATTGRFALESTQMGAAGAITFTDGDGSFLQRLGFGANNTVAGAAHEVQAADSEIRIQSPDGIWTTFEQQSNVFTNVKGMNITINTALAQVGDILEVNLERNTTATMDMIRNFVEEYNRLIASMRDLTETRRPRENGSHFLPLTEEQRRGMSEREIEQWEEQARTGILHRDETLRRLSNDLRSAIFQPVDLGDGRRISLLDIGIRTSSDPREFGTLQIDEERLERALNERPDDVATLFTRNPDVPASGNRQQRIATGGVAGRINDIMNWTMGVGGGLFERAGVAGAVSDHDNQMSRRIAAEERRIDDMIRNLERREERYFAMFSRLEVAMMQSHSQMMFLEQMLWGNF